MIKSCCSPACQIKKILLLVCQVDSLPHDVSFARTARLFTSLSSRLYDLALMSTSPNSHLHSLNTFPFPLSPSYLSFPTLSTALSFPAHCLPDSPPITHKPCSDKCYLSIIRLVQFIICQMKYNWYALITTLKCLTDARGLMVMIDMVNSVQILDEAVCIFHWANTLRKDMYPSILSSGIAN